MSSTSGSGRLIGWVLIDYGSGKIKSAHQHFALAGERGGRSSAEAARAGAVQARVILRRQRLLTELIDRAFAVARGVYEATAWPGTGVTAWRDLG